MTNAQLNGYILGYMRKAAEGSTETTVSDKLPFGLGSIDKTIITPAVDAKSKLKNWWRMQVSGKPVEISHGSRVAYIPGDSAYVAAAGLGGAGGALLGSGVGALKGNTLAGLTAGGLTGAAAAPALLYLLHRLEILQEVREQSTSVKSV